MLVIGSGPSGQKAAIQAAKLGKRVAVAERKDRLGGVSIHTGTIPSKTLREAVLDQLAERPLDVLDPTRMEETERMALQQLMDRAAKVIGAETAVVREQFRRNMVGWLPGGACFEDDHTVKIEGSDEPIHAERIVIAVGTKPGAAGDRRLRRPHDHRLGRPAAHGPPRPALDDRGRRGRDRRGVRVDVRLARARRSPSSTSASTCSASSTARSSRPSSTCCGATTSRSACARASRRSSRSSGQRAHPARLGQDDQLGDRALRGRPAGRDGRARDREDGAGGRQARPAEGRRRVPHDRPAHLRRGRRRGRRPRRDGDGAGPDRRAARLRRARDHAAAADPDRRLRDPRDRHGRAHGGGAHGLHAALRGRDRALDGARPRADDGRRARDAQAARRPRATAACSAST